ncbi:hypothetical protein LB526_06720 [Mesorhizobium sp. CA6]|uniref:HEPN domain-containing protein n=1 Tax=Mesorhizobium sp. CA6 TaxID=588500 RepID=UPI001CCC3FF0|nr:HEPN domain-containing protein [Mesorhizobium sp. CA6]MBZ9766451.1 hypothetical protein [Mesorhizobium sp. CA6]
MASDRFKDLQARVSELKRLLLPSKFDPTGTYKDPLRVTTRALSFRVLTHAEVETYLEDRVLEIATTALDAWETKKFVSVVTFHLIGFSGRATDRPPDTLNTTEQNKIKEWPSKTFIDDRFSKCVSEFHKRVRLENHGVKEKNIMEMFVPIGFDMGKCDAIFLQTMSNFGEARGAVAHTSGKGHVQKAVDPKDEYTTLQKIIASLEVIDVEFDRLLNASKAPK